MKKGILCPPKSNLSVFIQTVLTGAVILRFQAKVDGIGYTDYRVIPEQAYVPEKNKLALKTAQNTIEIDTDIYNIIFDLTKGASIVRLYDKLTERDFAQGVAGLGSLRGFSVKENAFISNADSITECEMLENGSICAKLKFSGTFHNIQFQNVYTLRRFDRRIDCETSVWFREETDIGYPYTPETDEKILRQKTLIMPGGL